MAAQNDLSRSQLFTLAAGTLALGAENQLPPLEQLSPGQVIDNKYRIISMLGEGGMGAVYKAQHLTLGKEVALKTFRSEMHSEEAHLRFQREAQALARLMHKNVVAVFDFGFQNDNLPYYTMACLQGESLGDRVKREGAVPLKQALPLFIQAAQGLASVHRKGIVHRDLKPGNIFIESGASKSASPNIKLVDFGIAALAGNEEDQKLTSIGKIFGSPLYMSPEQSLGEPVTPKSDIYSFGCTIYEVLTGKPPFTGATALQTILMHQSKMPPPMVVPDGAELPPTVARLVNAMLSKNPEKRPTNFEAVEAELSALAGKNLEIEPVSVSRPGNPAAGVQKVRGVQQEPEEFEEAEASEEPTEPVQPSPLLLVVPFVAIVLIASTALLYLEYQKKNSSNNTVEVATLPVAKDTLNHSKAVHVRPTDIIDIGLPDKVGDHSSKALLQQLDDNDSLIKAEHYTDSFGTSMVRLTFPKDVIVGSLTIGLQAEATIKEAVGVVEFPEKLFLIFEPTPEFMHKPSRLAAFKTIRLDGLNLGRLVMGKNKVAILEQIIQFPNLISLDMYQNDLDDDDVTNYLNKLPKLRVLNVSSGQITGPGLTKLKTLKQLFCLRIGGNSDCRPVFKALQNSVFIQMLSVDSSRLDHNDFKLIAGLKNLTYLRAHTTSLDDQDMTQLSRLKMLKTLDAQRTNVTIACYPSLATMRRQGLVELAISSASFTLADMNKIRGLYPGVKIENTEAVKEKAKDGLMVPFPEKL